MAQAYEWKGAKWKKVTDAVTNFIAEDSLPICTVQKSSFKRLVRTFDARCQLPSRSYLSRRCYSNDSAHQAFECIVGM